MKLLFGLGNPGKKYDATRHNVGFMVLDALGQLHNATFTHKPKFAAYLAEIVIEGEKVVLAKPDTFYNEAGRSYRSLLDFYKLNPTDTLVIHDELALPFGTVRVRDGGSDAGNNGIKSVNLHGGEASARIRIGAGNDKRALIGDVDFVLSNFSSDEQHLLVNDITPEVIRLVHAFAAGNHAPTSLKLSDKQLEE